MRCNAAVHKHISFGFTQPLQRKVNSYDLNSLNYAQCQTLTYDKRLSWSPQLVTMSFFFLSRKV